VERCVILGFSLPLTLIFLVIFATLFIIFGWIVLPIAVGIFLIISVSVAIHDRLKQSKSPKERYLNLILYRAIFNRSEEQAKAIAEDLINRESMDFIESAISEIQNELNAPSLLLTELHPYSGNPTEKEIRAFLTLVLQEIKDKHNPPRSG
jgi:hypothetical protein